MDTVEKISKTLDETYNLGIQHSINEARDMKLKPTTSAEQYQILDILIKILETLKKPNL